MFCLSFFTKKKRTIIKKGKIIGVESWEGSTDGTHIMCFSNWWKMPGRETRGRFIDSTPFLPFFLGGGPSCPIIPWEVGLSVTWGWGTLGGKLERERERPINIHYSVTFYLVILSQIENLELNDIVLPILLQPHPDPGTSI
jgi:hypothetical protein